MAIGFMGEYNHTVDAKGRLIIPASYRDKLGEKFVVTKGIDNCLVAYGMDEWEKLVAKLSEISMTKGNNRIFSRFMLGKAGEVEIDSHGRILLGAAFREYAQIQKEVVLVGAGKYIEIWAKDKYEEAMDALDISAIAEELDAAGISI